MKHEMVHDVAAAQNLKQQGARKCKTRRTVLLYAPNITPYNLVSFLNETLSSISEAKSSNDASS